MAVAVPAASCGRCCSSLQPLQPRSVRASAQAFVVAAGRSPARAAGQSAVLRTEWRAPGREMQRQRLLCSAGPDANATAATAAVQAAATGGGTAKIGVLFVCLGNICRSPTAEAVFSATVQKAGLADKFHIDSCGTGGGNPDWFMEGGWSYHEGDPADSRMTVAAKRRGVTLTSRSRPLKPQDFSRFDYIIAMDPNNTRAIQTAGDYWSMRPMGQGVVPANYRNRLSLMTSYCTKFTEVPEVPDPYYGGPAGFERVLDLLEDASQGLLEHISSSSSKGAPGAA